MIQLDLFASIDDFRDAMNDHFPELAKYLSIDDETPVMEAVEKICKCVGFQKSLATETVQFYIIELWEYMIKNKAMYHYWIL